MMVAILFTEYKSWSDELYLLFRILFRDMSYEEINKLRLQQMYHDLQENLIPRSKSFSRHFVLHSLDLLSILNTIFKSQNNNPLMDKIKETERTNNTETSTTDIVPEGIGTQVSEPAAGGEASTSMPSTNKINVDTTEKWKKRLKNILKNPNITDEVKAELVVEELEMKRRTEDLLRERQLIPPNKRLLGGADTTKDSSQPKQKK